MPIVACVIGEGGSGGAIAIALADRVLMQENAIYSVISPEGCAAILWRDAGEARKAAAAFKPDAAHCLELGVIDGIVPEPAGGAQNDWKEAARLLKESLGEALDELEGLSGEELVRRGAREVPRDGRFRVACNFPTFPGIFHSLARGLCPDRPRGFSPVSNSTLVKLRADTRHVATASVSRRRGRKLSVAGAT